MRKSPATCRATPLMLALAAVGVHMGAMLAVTGLIAAGMTCGRRIKYAQGGYLMYQPFDLLSPNLLGVAVQVLE